MLLVRKGVRGDEKRTKKVRYRNGQKEKEREKQSSALTRSRQVLKKTVFVFVISDFFL